MCGEARVAGRGHQTDENGLQLFGHSWKHSPAKAVKPAFFEALVAVGMVPENHLLLFQSLLWLQSAVCLLAAP